MPKSTAAWAKRIAQHFFFVPHNVPAWLRHRKPIITQQHDRKANADQVNCKHTSFWAQTLVMWHHNHLIEMVTCFAYGANSEAACASQRPHTISCGHAMCFLFFQAVSHLRVQPLALATTFAIALRPVLLLFLPAMQLCSLVATCVAKGFCSQPQICHWIFRPCFYLCHVFASVFLAASVAITFVPVVFLSIHVALQIATAIALEVAIVVAIKFGRLIESIVLEFLDKPVPAEGLFTRKCTHKQMVLVANGVAPSAKARASAMVRFQKFLGSTDFFSRIEGTLVTKTIGFTVAQAKLHGIAQNIHAVKHDKAPACPLQVAAGQVLPPCKWRKVPPTVCIQRYKKFATWSSVTDTAYSAEKCFNEVKLVVRLWVVSTTQRLVSDPLVFFDH